MKVYHEEFGNGKIIGSTEKLDESGSIVSADVMFEHGIEQDLPLFEVTYSAKKAAAGKDIGKPGKQFKKIAAKAAKKYGSAAAGGRVAGAILKKLRTEGAGDNSVQIQGTESPTVASTHPDPYKKGHLPKDVKKHGARGQETYGEEVENVEEDLKADMKSLDKVQFPNKASAHKVFSKAAVQTGKEAQDVRSGKIWSGDKERGKSIRAHAVMTSKLARLSKEETETEELDEKLIGNQKKIDKNHNGKLDADDFKKLRKEEVSESVVRVTPDTAATRMPAVESVVRSIMSQGRNLRQEAKIQEFKNRNK